VKQVKRETWTSLICCSLRTQIHSFHEDHNFNQHRMIISVTQDQSVQLTNECIQYALTATWRGSNSSLVLQPMNDYRQ